MESYQLALKKALLPKSVEKQHDNTLTTLVEYERLDQTHFSFSYSVDDNIDIRMHHFINSNPGLKSRFNKYFHFPDYNVDELIQIMKSMLKKYQYSVTSQGMEKIQQTIIEMEFQKGINFANARDIRNYFEK